MTKKLCFCHPTDLLNSLVHIFSDNSLFSVIEANSILCIVNESRKYDQDAEIVIIEFPINIHYCNVLRDLTINVDKYHPLT